MLKRCLHLYFLQILPLLNLLTGPLLFAFFGYIVANRLSGFLLTAPNLWFGFAGNAGVLIYFFLFDFDCLFLFSLSFAPLSPMFPPLG
jgi:hypothetical protein